MYSAESTLNDAAPFACTCTNECKRSCLQSHELHSFADCLTFAGPSKVLKWTPLLGSFKKEAEAM